MKEASMMWTWDKILVGACHVHGLKQAPVQRTPRRVSVHSNSQIHGYDMDNKDKSLCHVRVSITFEPQREKNTKSSFRDCEGNTPAEKYRLTLNQGKPSFTQCPFDEISFTWSRWIQWTCNLPSCVIMLNFMGCSSLRGTFIGWSICAFLYFPS